MAKSQDVVTAAAAQGAVAKVSGQIVVVVAAMQAVTVVVVVVLVAALAAALHVTMIAMESSSLLAHKAHAHLKARAVVVVLVDPVVLAWANPLVLRMSRAHPVPQPASQIRCAPASI